MSSARRPKPNPLRHADDVNYDSSPSSVAATTISVTQQSRTVDKDGYMYQPALPVEAHGQHEEHAGSSGSGGEPQLMTGMHGGGGTLVACCAAIGGVSFALLNLCSFFKGVDDSVLPAVFLEVGSTLGVGPQSLGTLGMIGAFSVGLAAPPSGWLGTRYSRPRLIAYGCFTWSIGAVGMGACSSYLMLALSRGVNGIGLGIIGPLMYGMVVDSWEPHQRGKALGVLGITGSIGGLTGGWFATTIGSTTILGFAGWRFPLYVCALTGALIGVLVYACVVDPAKAPGGSSTKQEEGIWETLTAVWRETKECMRIPTFWVIVAQGCFGSTPWAAWGFSTLWLQLICFQSESAANIRAMFTVGNILGTLFGGWLGDKASMLYPDHGRPWVAVVSVGIGVPLTYIMLYVLPQGQTVEEAEQLVYIWMSFFFVYGFSIVWVVGVNGPIFSEIVPAKHRTYIFSLDQAFELCVSSIGGPLSGYIAERAGFVDENIEVCDRVNGEALATGMVWVMTIPWTVCACLYGVLHFTYPRDRRRVLARVGDATGDMQASLANGPTANEQGGWRNDGDVASSDSYCGCCCGGCVPERDEYTPLKDSDSI